MAWLGAKAVDNTVPLTSAGLPDGAEDSRRPAVHRVVPAQHAATALGLRAHARGGGPAAAVPAPVECLDRLRLRVAFLFVIRGYFTLPQSPFLYFNF